jgi:hypothetical protein
MRIGQKKRAVYSTQRLSRLVFVIKKIEALRPCFLIVLFRLLCVVCVCVCSPNRIRQCQTHTGKKKKKIFNHLALLSLSLSDSSIYVKRP